MAYFSTYTSSKKGYTMCSNSCIVVSNSSKGSNPFFISILCSSLKAKPQQSSANRFLNLTFIFFMNQI